MCRQCMWEKCTQKREKGKCEDPEVGTCLGMFEEQIAQNNEKDCVSLVWLKSGQDRLEGRLVK